LEKRDPRAVNPRKTRRIAPGGRKKKKYGGWTLFLQGIKLHGGRSQKESPQQTKKRWRRRKKPPFERIEWSWV